MFQVVVSILVRLHVTGHDGLFSPKTWGKVTIGDQRPVSDILAVERSTRVIVHRNKRVNYSFSCPQFQKRKNEIVF